MADHTCLNGTLIRNGKDQWCWADGSPAAEVTDLSPSAHYNFRCQGGAVQVPLAACHRERDVLGWVLDGVERGRYRQGVSGDHTGSRVMQLTESYGEGDTPGVSTPDVGVSITRQSVRPDGSPTNRAIPRVALVPIADWDAWAADHPYGAQWPAERQADLFATARRLGWEG